MQMVFLFVANVSAPLNVGNAIYQNICETSKKLTLSNLSLKLKQFFFFLRQRLQNNGYQISASVDFTSGLIKRFAGVLHANAPLFLTTWNNKNMFSNNNIETQSIGRTYISFVQRSSFNDAVAIIEPQSMFVDQLKTICY